MQHLTIGTADRVPTAAIQALRSEMGAKALRTRSAFDRGIANALDRVHGAGNWALCWDEDLRGRPIRGTVTVVYGGETLVIG